MTTELLFHGVIHSSAAPFATAVIIDDGVVTWLGDDDTARTRMGSVDSVLDLSGALVLPALMNVTLPGDDPLVRDGVIACDLVTTERAERRQIIDMRHSSDAVARTIEVLRAQARSDGEASIRAQQLIMVVDEGLLNEMVTDLTYWGVTIVVAVSGEPQPTIHAPLAALARAGIPFVLTTPSHSSPWDTIRSAVHGAGEQGLTARAAFRAHSRAVWRLYGANEAGEIRIGAPAALAWWRSNALGVETPHGDALPANGASWSQDARAGTPLLPILGTSEQLPVCEGYRYVSA